jgi:hypothetical protein
VAHPGGRIGRTDRQTDRPTDRPCLTATAIGLVCTTPTNQPTDRPIAPPRARTARVAHRGRSVGRSVGVSVGRSGPGRSAHPPPARAVLPRAASIRSSVRRLVRRWRRRQSSAGCAHTDGRSMVSEAVLSPARAVAHSRPTVSLARAATAARPLRRLSVRGRR